MELRNVALEDKYSNDNGPVFMSGTQALVRLPMLQQARDARLGKQTACLISGYRGSPLGAYDQALGKEAKRLALQHIKFLPGVNEDLAATALWGTQQTGLFEGARFDGVFGIWYGKNPGVDRCGDVFRHANQSGTAAWGGVLALAGDDVGAKSSTIAAQTDFIFSAVNMPVLAPATIQDYLDLGLHGFAMSRFAGVWVGFRCVTDSVETSSVVELDPMRPHIVIPQFDMPVGGLSIRWPEESFLKMEERLARFKLPAVLAYARANRLDRCVTFKSSAQLGIVATGKAFLDVMQALADIGLDERTAADAGISVYKVAMPWPLDTVSALEYVAQVQQVLVVEEKRSLVEYQLKDALYSSASRVAVHGKKDQYGAQCIPEYGELTTAIVLQAILQVIQSQNSSEYVDLAVRIKRRLEQIARAESGSGREFEVLQRIPYFCSGCPHNTSTKVPEGSRALAGIGCHYMSLWMDRSTATFTHMGGEGAQWVGQAPFTQTEHVFQNLGDGTYFHSGYLAIRQAVAAKTRITYKILFNDAVAMTGGQMHDGALTPMAIAAQTAAEGVSKIVVVTDDPEKYPVGAFVSNVSIFHRSDLDTVQRMLRDHADVSVLIYDQTCASEKRRRRKRGAYPDPAKRAFINAAVCEGCGDCGVKSNCVSVEPLETELGRKRQINQSSCNKDFSCVNGFCPSFVTVHGGELKRGVVSVKNLPLPVNLPSPDNVKIANAIDYALMVTGVGGTGVVTIGQILGMAAHCEGKKVSVLDMAGLAQKGGAVWSFIRFGVAAGSSRASRLQSAGADALIGCELVVSASRDTLNKLKPNARVVVNSNRVPTADFTHNPNWQFPQGSMEAAIADTVGGDNVRTIDAGLLATQLIGNAIAANLFLLGFAYQQGLLPLHHASIEKAIELNGVSVKQSLSAFAWGRQAAIDPASVYSACAITPAADSGKAELTVEQLIVDRAMRLHQYQNADLAAQYRSLVLQATDWESAIAPNNHGDKFAKTVARYTFKLMAYKDEYEVARLYSDGVFKEQLAQQFDGDYRLEFHLAPPLFSKVNAQGELIKQSFGAWMMPVFAVLARLKFLRGTRLDVFGYSAERQSERRWITDYTSAIKTICSSQQGVEGQLDADKMALACEIAAIPELIRGFGHVKARNQAIACERLSTLMNDWLDWDKVTAAAGSKQVAAKTPRVIEMKRAA